MTACLALVAAAPAQASFGFLGRWGEDGSANGQFDRPGEIATDTAGNVYVVDPGNNRIQKFDSSGAFLTKWGSEGDGPGQFHGLGSIATDRAGNVYVSNPWTNNTDQIQKFTSNGGFITRWESNASVGAMAGGPDGNLYIASSGLYYEEIQKLGPDGTVIERWGPDSSGAGDGQFRGLLDIAVAPDGSVYALDRGFAGSFRYSPRVQRFSSSGTFLTKWGSEGSGDGQFNGDTLGGLAIGADGNVWVSDNSGGTDDPKLPEAAPRVQGFTPTGSFVRKLTGSDSSDRSFLCLEDGIATGAAGSVYVVEWCASRIWKFGPGGVDLAACANAERRLEKAQAKRKQAKRKLRREKQKLRRARSGADRSKVGKARKNVKRANKKANRTQKKVKQARRAARKAC